MTHLFPSLVRCLPQIISQCRLKTSGLHTCDTKSFRNINQPIRLISTSLLRNQENEEAVAEEEKVDPRIPKNPAKDRRNPIPVETSIRYLQSAAFKEAYGEDPVWVHYRRNHKGGIPKSRTRKTCIRAGIVSCGSPCPVCRDEYLIVDYQNLELLKHFICPNTGEILPFKKTGVCQLQHKKLLVALRQAKSLGLIPFDVPFRKYDYSEYKPE